MMETTQYTYSIKFSAGTIALMILLLLLLLPGVVRTNTALSWILFGLFSVMSVFILALLVLKRLIPAIKGDIALALDEQGINDYIRDVSIEWKDIKAISLMRGRSAAVLKVDLKFESDYGSSLSIPLRWVTGNDDDIYDTVLAYFENDELDDIIE